MTVESEDYKLEVLEYAVNQCIDRLLPESNKDALSVIIYRNNEVVWKVATEIYTKSGHKIDFSFVRNFLNLRIEPLRIKIKEEARIKEELEELEAQRRMREVEEEGIKKKKEELKVFEKIKSVIVKQLEVKEEQVKFNTLFKHLLPESYNDYRNSMKRENTWCSSSLAISDKDSDSIELIMAVEEEFDIEIDDQELDYTELSSWNVRELVKLVMQKI